MIGAAKATSSTAYAMASGIVHRPTRYTTTWTPTTAARIAMSAGIVSAPMSERGMESTPRRCR